MLTLCLWSASPVVRGVRLHIIESLQKREEPEKEAKLSLGEAGKGASLITMIWDESELF